MEFLKPIPAFGALQRVLGVQSHLAVRDRQVPEPWRGSPHSPLLFVSSNPSIDPFDDSPVAGDSDAYIETYFNTGFDPACFPHIRLRRNVRGRPTKVVRFWASMRSIACELWGYSSPSEFRPGLDSSLMELVPYKSLREVGVAEAVPHCMKQWWDPRIEVMEAKVIVVLGALARKALDLPAAQCIETIMGQRERFVIALPHPASYSVGKRPSSVVDPHTMDRIRDLLRKHRLLQIDLAANNSEGGAPAYDITH